MTTTLFERKARLVTVRARSATSTRGRLTIGGNTYACALGRSGRRVSKREGDGATPVGSWRLIEVFYRSDRVRRPCTKLPVRGLRLSDGWCDEVRDRNYNRYVRHPYPASAEALWRGDRVYDIVVVLSHNRVPRVRGHGSAVFMHLARPGFTPTEGCVALADRELRLLLAGANRHTRLLVVG